MKYFLALAIFAFVASAFAQLKLTDEQKAKIAEHGKICKQKIAISDEEVETLRNRDFSNPSDAQKCFGRCIFEQAGSIKGDVVQEDVIMQHLGPILGEDKVKALMAKCNGLKGDNECDSAFKVFQCYELAQQLN